MGSLLAPIMAAFLSVTGCVSPGAVEPSQQDDSRQAACHVQPGFRTGLDRLQAVGFASLRGKRVGVVTNPTGVDRAFRPLPELIASASGVTLAAVFGPEHGLTGSVAAGKPVKDALDPRTGVPVYSLYGEVLRPTKQMLEGIDVLLFDIQDVGVRPYTYLATLAELLAAAGQAGPPGSPGPPGSRVVTGSLGAARPAGTAAESGASGPEVWVLDRPVPIGGGTVEGPVLEPGRESFVGPHTIALRHGLTAGEFAAMVNEERGFGARLRVVEMQGYRRDMLFEETGLVWIAPSPNIPTIDTAAVYAGMVLVEGTNLSEGRGTTRPFQLIGAPWMDGDTVASMLRSLRIPGCAFRACRFIPADSKYRGEECVGVEVHVTDRRAYPSVTAAVALLLAVKAVHPDKLEIKARGFDLLAGTSTLREAIEAGRPLDEIVESWRAQLEAYCKRREKHLLYR